MFIWAEPINSAHLLFFSFNLGKLHGPGPIIQPFYFWVVALFFFFQMGPNYQVLICGSQISDSGLWSLLSWSCSSDFNMPIIKHQYLNQNRQKTSVILQITRSNNLLHQHTYNISFKNREKIHEILEFTMPK